MNYSKFLTALGVISLSSSAYPLLQIDARSISNTFPAFTGLEYSGGLFLSAGNGIP